MTTATIDSPRLQCLCSCYDPALPILCPLILPAHLHWPACSSYLTHLFYAAFTPVVRLLFLYHACLLLTFIRDIYTVAARFLVAVYLLFWWHCLRSRTALLDCGRLHCGFILTLYGRTAGLRALPVDPFVRDIAAVVVRTVVRAVYVVSAIVQQPAFWTNAYACRYLHTLPTCHGYRLPVV